MNKLIIKSLILSLIFIFCSNISFSANKNDENVYTTVFVDNTFFTMRDVIKDHGIITYKTYEMGHDLKYGIFEPIGTDEYPLINSNLPETMLFSGLSRNEIKNINFEDQLLKNNFNKTYSGYGLKLDFNKIEPFGTYYVELLKKGKLSIYKDKEVVINKLISVLDDYKRENKKLTSSVFSLSPSINSHSIITEENYDVDKAKLKLSMNKVSNSYTNFYGFPVYVGGSGNALGIYNLKLYGEFLIDLKIDDAIYLFENYKSVKYYYSVYIEPRNDFIGVLWGGIQNFNVKYILFRMSSIDGNPIMDILLHKFTPQFRNGDNRSQPYRYDWSTSIYKFKQS